MRSEGNKNQSTTRTLLMATMRGEQEQTAVICIVPLHSFLLFGAEWERINLISCVLKTRYEIKLEF